MRRSGWKGNNAVNIMTNAKTACNVILRCLPPFRLEASACLITYIYSYFFISDYSIHQKISKIFISCFFFYIHISLLILISCVFLFFSIKESVVYLLDFIKIFKVKYIIELL